MVAPSTLPRLFCLKIEGSEVEEVDDVVLLVLVESEELESESLVELSLVFHMDMLIVR